MRRYGVAALVGFIGCIFVANWVVDRYGIVPVGFGLMAPAAVYVVGVAFTLRDVVQRNFGPWVAGLAVLVGAALSAIVSPQLALASGVAFLVSEAVDLGVFTAIGEDRWLPAVVVSNLVGLVIDSLLFLWLAFGSLEFLPGQLVGKAWMTLLAVAVLALLRTRRHSAEAAT